MAAPTSTPPAWPCAQLAEDTRQCSGVAIHLELDREGGRARCTTLAGDAAAYLGLGAGACETVEQELVALLGLMPRPGFRAHWLALLSRLCGKDVICFPRDRLSATLATELRVMLATREALRARVRATMPGYREGMPDMAHIAWAPPYDGVFRAHVSDLELEVQVLLVAARQWRAVRSASGERGMVYG